MFVIPKSVAQWVKAVIAAFVSGAATSFLNALGVTGANMIGIHIEQFTPKQLMATTLVGALIGVALYLKTAPVPPGGDTAFVNKDQTKP